MYTLDVDSVLCELYLSKAGKINNLNFFNKEMKIISITGIEVSANHTGINNPDPVINRHQGLLEEMNFSLIKDIKWCQRGLQGAVGTQEEVLSMHKRVAPGKPERLHRGGDM